MFKFNLFPSNIYNFISTLFQHKCLFVYLFILLLTITLQPLHLVSNGSCSIYAKAHSKCSPFDIPFNLNLEETQESKSSVPVLAAFFCQEGT